MEIFLRFDLENIDWKSVCEIFEKAPLGTRDPVKLMIASENSAVVCFAWDSNRIIGFGRALSDGVTCAAIYDLCLLPEYQSKGIGRLIMNGILEKLQNQNVILYAVPGKQGFYEKLGFKTMLTAMGSFIDMEKMKQMNYISKD
ncbi:GNAT family N-acetyltransferase [Desulfovibrio gilichinskyi]|uniref:Acetyltransferase (GNAT) domain-containing protein n=1 Tax=Desulfovibrio gilichinskyi TaxID=1519643 RepID=A0A1X7EKI1_9BACT|nr:GNAT family N-acetyltransferase [Desulfovibrio gilichinskyi]SMF35460.1 Acetyltransferase (GNAT) domain-containing protein [Desulfovibrio gilichinskyi]